MYCFGALELGRLFLVSLWKLTTQDGCLHCPGNIRVFCRVRPLLSNERNARVGHLTTTPGTDTITVVSCRKDFQFDKVFLPSSVQGEFTI